MGRSVSPRRDRRRRHSSHHSRSRSRRQRTPCDRDRERSLSPRSTRLIERFLDEERLLLEKMSLEKRRYTSAPETHPDYNREWERFYNYKRTHYGPIHASRLHDE